MINKQKGYNKPKNKNDDMCFKYARAAALNHDKI